MEVSCFLSIQRVWYIGTFVLGASSIGTDSVRLAHSGLNQVGLQQRRAHFQFFGTFVRNSFIGFGCVDSF